MMKTLRYFLLSVLCCACSGPMAIVVQNSTPVEWSNYKTYSFGKLDVVGDTTGAAFHEQLSTVKKSFAKQMEARGFIKNKVNPDFNINIEMKVKEGYENPQPLLIEEPDSDRRSVRNKNHEWKSNSADVDGRLVDADFVFYLVDSHSHEELWQGSFKDVLSTRQKVLADEMDYTFAGALKSFPIAATKHE